MSKSDAQRRSYLADQMTVMERVEALERQTQMLKDTKATVDWAEYVDKRLGALQNKVDEIESGYAADDSQYFHDELRSLGRRIADLESSGTTRKPTNPGMTHFVGDDCAGGHRVTLGRFDSVDFKPSDYVTGEMVDRWRRIEEAARDLLSFDPDERPYGWNMCIDALTEALKP